MSNLETDMSLDALLELDVLKWKQENQALIRRETAGMTREQIRERLRQAVEEDIRLRAERASKSQI